MFRSRRIVAAATVVGAGLFVPLAQSQSATNQHAGRSGRFQNTHGPAVKRAADSNAPNPIPNELLSAITETQGFLIAPVPLNMDGKDPKVVGRGSYLVNASGCNDCHTNPSYADGGDPFKGQPEKVNASGYLGGGQKFGPFTSRNLTPEPENGMKPAGMDFTEFVHVIRSGEDTDKAHPQMGPLLQVMPWPTIRKLTDDDLYAMYEYLRAIPPVKVPGVQ